MVCLLMGRSRCESSGYSCAATLNNRMVKGARTRVSPDEVTRAAVGSQEEHLLKERISKLGPVKMA